MLDKLKKKEFEIYLLKDFYSISRTNIDEDKHKHVHVLKDYSLRVRST